MGNGENQQLLRVINSAAPIRICDNGGWTDTWFAEHGKVFNIAVRPCAEVQIEVYPRAAQQEHITLSAENFSDSYPVHLESPARGPHPLLEAAIKRMGVPDGVAVRITVSSEAPAGASTGTSAAVTVALIGALDALTPGRLTPYEAARAAHSVEVDMLGQQSGIQDQLCAAYGGINYIEMPRYPHATVSQIHLPDPLWRELERRLALVYLGRSHSSSQVHEKVIRELQDAGPDCKKLNDLRATAEKSRDAVLDGDFAALGQAMIENTEAQGRLHPDLVSREALRVMEIAREHGALGWKVNGAGGEGGSVTILCGPQSQAKQAMLREMERENPLFKSIPIRLSREGLRVWK